MDSKSKSICKHIVKSFSLGNVEAFNSIYSQYKPKVFNYALKFVKDKDEAEEISQDIFVRLWKYRSSTDPEKDFDAFIYTVARNVIFKEFKRKLRETSYLAEQSNCIVENYDPIDSYINLKEYKEFASKAIDSLPPQAKKVFKLSREEGQSYECIASKLAISPSTVHNHMTKSLRHIRKYFDYHIPETILFCILLTKVFFR